MQVLINIYVFKIIAFRKKPFKAKIFLEKSI